MKAQFIILFLLAGLLTSESYAGNGSNDPQQQGDKKTAKPKYDFNIFKFFSVPAQQQSPDSLKTTTTKSKTIILTKKDYYYSKPEVKG